MNNKKYEFYKAELIDIEEKHLNLILEWRNQERIREVMYKREIITESEHKTWFGKLKDSQTNISKIFYYDGTPYGILNINNIDNKNGNCEWGFYIGDATAPRGMGTVLGNLGLEFIFGSLELRKVSANVLETNRISQKFHEKFGFIIEGNMRAHIYRDNRYIDVLLYSLLKKEWNGIYPERFELR